MNNQSNELVIYDDFNAIDTINKYISEAPNGWLNKVRFNKQLVQFLYDRFPLLQDKFYTNGTRIYWLLNGLAKFPRCVYCGCEMKNKNVYLAQGYPECCCNQHAQKLYFQNLSENDKEMVRNRGRGWYLNKTKDELREIQIRIIQTQIDRYGDIYSKTKEGIEKSIAWMSTKSEDELQDINRRKSKSLKRWRRNMPEYKKQHMLEKQREYWDNMSNEDKQKISEQRAKQSKGWWESASKSDIENRVKNAGFGVQKYYDNMTQEQKDEFRLKRKLDMSKETDEHKRIRAERVRQTFKNKSDEEKASIQRKIQFSRCRNFKKKNRIVVDGFVFDSKQETYVYQTCKNLGYKVVPHPNTPIGFLFNGKMKYYYPDFNINGKFVEVKGDHFFKINESTGKEEMFLPWKGKLTDQEYQYRCMLQEAKHQCMKKNGVIIIKSSKVFSYNYNVLSVDEK